MAKGVEAEYGEWRDRLEEAVGGGQKKGGRGEEGTAGGVVEETMGSEDGEGGGGKEESVGGGESKAGWGEEETAGGDVAKGVGAE